jgi:hypothetical protein
LGCEGPQWHTAEISRRGKESGARARAEKGSTTVSRCSFVEAMLLLLLFRFLSLLPKLLPKETVFDVVRREVVNIFAF